MFEGHPLEQSIENQWTFLAQRLGGPPEYSQRKGELVAPGHLVVQRLRAVHRGCRRSPWHCSGGGRAPDLQLAPLPRPPLPPPIGAHAGAPRMMLRHARFPCNDETAAAWLHHAEVAFEAVPQIDDDSRRRITDFFR